MPARPAGPSSLSGEPPGKLLNVLGLAFGVAVIVGGSVGTGILNQPGAVARYLSHPALYLGAWLAGGLYVLLGAVCVAELAAMTPRSGGFYVYARRALGEYPGFVTGWAHWLALCSTGAFGSLLLAKAYLARLFPALEGHERTVAMLTIVAFALLQWRGVRGAGRVQEVTTLFKGLAFLALIVALLVLARPASGPGPTRPLPEGLAFVAAAVFSWQAILQAYDGWEGAIYFGEEMRDPGRTLPRSLITGVVVVIVIYMGVNVALLHVLSFHRIAGHDLPLAKATEEVFGARGETIFVVLATASILVMFNAATLQTPRVLYAMGRDGLFFPQAATVNAGGTPTVALLLTTVAILGLLAAEGLERLLAVLAFFLVTNYTLTFLALFALRRREPFADRPYRAWGHPWTTALGLVGSLVYLGASIATEAWHVSLSALLLLAASWPAYLAVRRLRAPHGAT